MPKFTWGKVIEYFEYDFDGVKMTVVKYHPYTSNTVGLGRAWSSEVLYHCEEIREGSNNLFYLIVSFMAHKKLGLNQRALVLGIAKSLELDRNEDGTLIEL